jgi:alanine racemase
VKLGVSAVLVRSSVRAAALAMHDMSGASSIKPLREAHVDIDLTKLAANLARLRANVGADCAIYAVIKGDGYGAGLVPAARALGAAAVDALAVGAADDVVTLRHAGVTTQILLYGSTPPDRAAELVSLDAILTVHDVASLHAILAATRTRHDPVRVFVKLDCGLARLGVAERDQDKVFSTLAAAPGIRVEGIYTHLAGQQDPRRVSVQAEKMAQACAVAAQYGVTPRIRMLASSRLILEHPDLTLTGVDPGRLVFGLSRDDWGIESEFEPVIAGFSARIVQVSDLDAGTIPYGAEQPLETPLRVGVIAAGTSDGLVFTQPGQPLLVRGKRVRQLGPPGIEHSMVDLTAAPDAAVGDEVVFFGQADGDAITPLAFARFCGRPIDQVIPLVGRLARRVYIHA